MPTAGEIEAALYELAPRALAAEWDNVGLLAGRADREVRKILVSLDIPLSFIPQRASRTGILPGGFCSGS